MRGEFNLKTKINGQNITSIEVVNLLGKICLRIKTPPSQREQKTNKTGKTNILDNTYFLPLKDLIIVWTH